MCARRYELRKIRIGGIFDAFRHKRNRELDKYEYKISLNEINRLISEHRFQEAAQIADTIDWNRVKTVTTLCKISDVYKANREFTKSRKVLLLALKRSPGTPEIIYNLCELTIYLYGQNGMQSDLASALQLLQEYQAARPGDPRRLILQYKMYKVSPVSDEEKISILEQLKKEQHSARWGYELAVLYQKAGEDGKAREECRSITSSFQGKYADRAADLYAELLKKDEVPLKDPETEGEEEAAAPQETEAGKTEPDTVELPEEKTVPASREETGREPAGHSGEDQAAKEAAARIERELTKEEGEEDGSTENHPMTVGEAMEAAARRDAESETHREGEDASGYEANVTAGMEDLFTAEEEHPKAALSEETPSPEADEATGQMSINQVMDEWERIRRGIRTANDEKRAQRIMEDTGALLHDFDVTAQHGLLEDIEKGTERHRRRVRSGYREDLPDGRPARRSPSDAQPRYHDSYYTQSDRGLDPEDHSDQGEAYDPEERTYPEQDSYPEEGVYQDSYPEEGTDPQGSDYPAEAAGSEGRYDSPDTDRQVSHETLWSETAAVDLPSVEDISSGEAIAAGQVSAEAPAEEAVTDYGAGTAPEPEPAAADTDADVVRTEDPSAEKEQETEEETAVNVDVRYQPSGQKTEDPMETIATRKWNPDEIRKALEEQEARARSEALAEVRGTDRQQEKSGKEQSGKPDLIAEEESAAPVPVEEGTPAGEASEGEEGPAEEIPAAEESSAAEESVEAEELSESGKETDTAPAADDREPEEGIPEPEAIQQSDIAENGTGTDGQTAPADEPAPAAVIRTVHSSKGVPSRLPGDAVIRTETGRTLTLEEARLFGPILRVEQNHRQILAALDQISLASYTGNLIICGGEATALKTAQGILEITRKSDSNFTGRIVKATGSALNRLSTDKFAKTIEKIENGALIVSRAAEMDEETVTNLHRQLEGREHGLIVILMDVKKMLAPFLKRFQDKLGSFTARIEIHPLNDRALVSYGKDYAKSQDYSLDEFAEMALHSRISSMQTSKHHVTLKEVRDIVDEAISYASRKNLAALFAILSRKRYDADDRIIIREKDFTHY